MESSWETVPKRKGKATVSRKPAVAPTVDETLVGQMEMLRLFKTSECSVGKACPDPKQCNYCHSWENQNLVRRRDPFSIAYQAEQCEYVDTDACTNVQCPRGVNCPLAHTKFEIMYHPLYYKSLPCRDGGACKRGKQCAFAHGDLELQAARSLASIWDDEQSTAAAVVSGTGGQHDAAPSSTLGAFLPSVKPEAAVIRSVSTKQWSVSQPSGQREMSCLEISVERWQVDVLKGPRGKKVQDGIDEQARRCGMSRSDIIKGDPWMIQLHGPASDNFDFQAAQASKQIEKVWWNAKLNPNSSKKFQPRECRYLFDMEEGQAAVQQVRSEKKLDAIVLGDDHHVFAFGGGEKARNAGLHQLELLMTQGQHSAERERQDARLQAVQQELERVQREYIQLYKAHSKQESSLRTLELEFSKLDSDHLEELKSVREQLNSMKGDLVQPAGQHPSADAAFLVGERTEHHRFWLSGKKETLFRLDEGCNEFDEVRSHFLATISSNASIIQINRIQHADLFDQYLLKKRQMADYPNEKWLFHGADENAIKSIIRTGFNRSYAGKNATAYGKGCYFARDSSYSNRYASRNDRKERHMLLAWVVVGMYCEGNSSMCAPTDGCQSTVNRLIKPSIFVTYSDPQSYPAYHIVYRSD